MEFFSIYLLALKKKYCILHFNLMLKTAKRILSDLKENAEQPIDGIKIYLRDKQIDDDDNSLIQIQSV